MATAGYGTWKSPISSKMTTENGVELMILNVDGDPSFSDTVYWNEIHFNEKGRYVICSSDKPGDITHWTPPDFNARTTVHEYGGGDFFVYRGTVYFSNFKDQVLYKQVSPESVPEAVTDPSKAFRYTDGAFCQQKSRIYCIREDHEVIKEGAKEAENTVVAINPETKTQSVLVKGADFYASPRVSPDGRKIAWTQWIHPNMPWDSTEIWVAELSEAGDGIVEGTAHKVVGGRDASGQDLSVIQPSWTEDNDLLYIGDQTDWWNLYHVTKSGEHVNLHETKAEIGGPQWAFGKTAYVRDPTGGTRIATSFKGEFGVVDLEKKTYTSIDTGFLLHSRYGWTAAGSVYCIALSETKVPQVIRVNIDTGKVDVIHVSKVVTVDSGYISVPQKISWPTSHGEICHGLYYRPVNKDYQAPNGELPPLLIQAHGGPTGAFFPGLDLKLQYFTSRGFAALLVDYRGSTGYGKQYRHKLRNLWGVLDIEDCCSGVKYLISVGDVDSARICIDGRSAGGYTTLACLTFTDTFKVGVSHFGVGDLEALMQDTHKFESRYLDTLLMPFDKGGREICKQRSPIHNIHRLNTATGFFQGDEDKVVPPNQAETMYKAVKSKGLPTMFVLFKGEQHGFRKAENIQAALDGEFGFFAKVLGFEPADKGIELPIENL